MVFRLRSITAACLAMAVAAATPAAAWSDRAHKAIAMIAWNHMTPQARATANGLLDGNGVKDFAEASIWADQLGFENPDTKVWHFVMLDLGSPKIQPTCGPRGCIVIKLREFADDLASPGAPKTKRQFALKQLIHLVGDVHQPLHVADNNDRGGGCLPVSVRGGVSGMNLHSYWDAALVKKIDDDADDMAEKLDGKLTPDQSASWAGAPVRDKDWANAWAMESFEIARSVVYRLPSRPNCEDRSPPIRLGKDYEKRAEATASEQITKAGVRLAALLNELLGEARAS